QGGPPPLQTYIGLPSAAALRRASHRFVIQGISSNPPGSGLIWVRSFSNWSGAIGLGSAPLPGTTRILTDKHTRVSPVVRFTSILLVENKLPAQNSDHCYQLL